MEFKNLALKREFGSVRFVALDLHINCSEFYSLNFSIFIIFTVVSIFIIFIISFAIYN